MLSEQQARFVRKPRVAVLATARRDGAPHVAPVWYRYADDGAFELLTERGSQKVRNIERDPRVVLCIDDKSPPYHTVIVRGRASLREPPGDAWREGLAVHYLGEEAGRRYVAQDLHPNNVLVRIAVESVAGW